MIECNLSVVKIHEPCTHGLLVRNQFIEFIGCDCKSLQLGAGSLRDGTAGLERFKTVVEGFIEASGSRFVLIDMLVLKC